MNSYTFMLSIVTIKASIEMQLKCALIRSFTYNFAYIQCILQIQTNWNQYIHIYISFYSRFCFIHASTYVTCIIPGFGAIFICVTLRCSILKKKSIRLVLSLDVSLGRSGRKYSWRFRPRTFVILKYMRE